MDFRLLAYGGTIFDERLHFGFWSIPEGVLADFYGLTGQEISFGIGFQGTAAALIFRQRQSLENRGGYPYTLLFDPGGVVWRQFGWSAAELLIAIQSDSIGLALLSQPDGVTRDSVGSLVRKLAEISNLPSNTESAVPPIMEILAGSLALDEPLAVSSRHLGYSARPDMFEMARALNIGDELPVLCRTGLGWLVGGSLGHTAAFGLIVVIDDELPSPDEKVVACKEVGRRIIAEWRSVRSRYPEVLNELHGTPPWSWSIAPREVFARVSLASALLSPPVEDAKYAEVRRILSQADLLSAQIRAMAQSVAFQSSRIGEQGVLFLLDECWAGRVELGPDTLARCDRDTLVRELLRRGTPPSLPPARLRLDFGLHEVLWLEAIGKADRSKRLQMLPVGIEQLSGLKDHQALVDAAVPEDPTRAEMEYLEPLRKGPLNKALKSRLGPAQRRRAKKGQIDPPLYMRFVDDEGLRALYEDLKDLQDRKNTAGRLVHWCLENLDIPEAEGQLQLIATSPFRGLIPSHLKRDIANKTGELTNYNGAWGAYRALCDLYDGAEVDPPPIDAAELERLRDELVELMKNGQGGPNAPVLEKWLAPLPRHTSDPLRTAWSRSQIATSQRSQVRDSSTGIPFGGKARPKPGERPPFAFEPAVKDALFVQTDPESAQHVIAAAENDAAVREALSKVICAATAEDGAHFCTYFGEAEIAVTLLSLLPEQRIKVVEWLASNGRLLAYFGEQINCMVSRAFELSTGPPDVIWAVVDYLKSDVGELERWATTLRGKNNGPEFVRAINNLKREATV